jgi:hypothetical protein
MPAAEAAPAVRPIGPEPVPAVEMPPFESAVEDRPRPIERHRIEDTIRPEDRHRPLVSDLDDLRGPIGDRVGGATAGDMGAAAARIADGAMPNRETVYRTVYRVIYRVVDPVVDCPAMRVYRGDGRRHGGGGGENAKPHNISLYATSEYREAGMVNDRGRGGLQKREAKRRCGEG